MEQNKQTQPTESQLITTVYLVKEEGKLILMKVKPEQEAEFLVDYKGKILLSGDSIQEVIIRLNELM